MFRIFDCQMCVSPDKKWGHIFHLICHCYIGHSRWQGLVFTIKDGTLGLGCLQSKLEKFGTWEPREIWTFLRNQSLQANSKDSQKLGTWDLLLNYSKRQGYMQNVNCQVLPGPSSSFAGWLSYP